MNEIIHHRLIIDYDVWAPKSKAAQKELDKLLFGLKDGTILGSAGNIKATISEADR